MSRIVIQGRGFTMVVRRRLSLIRETIGAQVKTAPGGAQTPLIQGPRRPFKEID